MVTIVDVVRRLSSAGDVTSRRSPRRRQRHAVSLRPERLDGVVAEDVL